MNDFSKKLKGYFSKRESVFLILLFGALLIYLIARTLLIFYAHDELVTKWAYCIDWNYLPLQGYVDANNHFLFSFLSGLFMRLFSSDSLLVFRLPSLLAFPIYFFSVISLRPFFKQKSSFYVALLALAGSHFVFDFFNMGRGYALAWALLMATLSSLLYFYQSQKITQLFWALVFGLLGMYSNLSITPFLLILFFTVPLLSLLFKKPSRNKIVAVCALFLLSFYPFFYLVQYSFKLKEMGKLYLGSESDFWATTVYPLLHLNFGLNETFAQLLVGVLLAVILGAAFKYKLNYKAKPSIYILLFSLWGLLLLSIVIQNLLLNINFPEDRAIGHLLILSLLLFALALDRLKARKVAYLSLVFFGLSFLLKANLHHSQIYKYEQFDKSLLSSIPDTVKGIPTATAGKYWVMPNAMSRAGFFPAKAFQTVNSARDTLHDYILALAVDSSKFSDQYEVFKLDKLSETAVLKRKRFLDRRLIQEHTTSVDGDGEYYNLSKHFTEKAVYARISGTLYEVSTYKPCVILVTQETIKSKENLMYVGFDPVTACPIEKDGGINFDITFSILDYTEESSSLIFIYNPKRNQLKGDFKVSLYSTE
ncbi:MAG: hypothetical protein RIC95_10925 [Vicingaceae bacterium]